MKVIDRYKDESSHDYLMRKMRWRLWSNSERPNFWYSTDAEINNYKRWVNND